MTYHLPECPSPPSTVGEIIEQYGSVDAYNEAALSGEVSPLALVCICDRLRRYANRMERLRSGQQVGPSQGWWVDGYQTAIVEAREMIEDKFTTAIVMDVPSSEYVRNTILGVLDALAEEANVAHPAAIMPALSEDDLIVLNDNDHRIATVEGVVVSTDVDTATVPSNADSPAQDTFLNTEMD